MDKIKAMNTTCTKKTNWAIGKSQDETGWGLLEVLQLR